ncbi:MAG: dihydrodipicolinate synthase family protein [Pricia sp.]|nr:dihydrodipicolinate synthase family protein [Pricia sp.]
MNLPLKGIIPPIVTPLLENEALDSKGLGNLIEHILEGGVHGVFLLGTTGEGPSLSHNLRKQLVSEACALVNKRVPVLVCITDTSFEESLELAEHAKQMGADYLVVAPPYYFPISQVEMQEYLERLAPALPLPFLIYNMPSCTKLNLSIETIMKAKQLGAIGIKDSSGNLAYMHKVLKEFNADEKFTIMTGTELHLPEALKSGGHGTVAGGANFFPRLFVDFYEASLNNDTERLLELIKKVTWIGETIYNVGKFDSRYVKGTKCALSVMGICQDYMAMPLKPFNTEDCKKIKAYLEEFTQDAGFTTAG